MLVTDENKPGIEELYEVATNTSNLKQEAERRTAADILRDMAMSANALGLALARLRGEWESALKPTRRQPRTAKQFLAAGLVSSREVADLAHLGEKATFDAWFMRDMAAVMEGLSQLRPTRAALTVQALKWNIIDAEAKAAGVIRYWLDQNCPACEGRKWQLIPGTPTLSNRACPTCRGSGIGQVPHGQEGRRLANHLDQCLHRYKQGLKGRRSALAQIPPIDRLSKRMQGGDED